MTEKIGSDSIEEGTPRVFRFHGNPWEVRTQYRNEIIKLLTRESERSFNANEVSEIVECNPQTAQLILLELALEGLVHVQVTKAGYSKLFRINSEKIGESLTKVKPKMTFDYRREEEV